MPGVRRLRAEDLRRLAAGAGATAPACACGVYTARGWESVSAPLTEPAFECVGTLQAAMANDDAGATGEQTGDQAGDQAGERTGVPTLQEWHPAGTRYWSAEAPMAVDWFPCNRCAVWCCKACRRPFLQYTEFGGYYVDHRLRPVDAALVV